MASKTKDILLSALVELSQTHDLDKITVTDLVENCNISRQTFYYHFNDLYELYNYVFESAKAMILKEALEDNDWSKVVSNYIKFLKKYSPFLQKAIKSEHCLAVVKFMNNSITDIINCFMEKFPQVKQNYKGDIEFDIKYNAYACTGFIVEKIYKNETDFETLIMPASNILYQHFKSHLK